jgi:hypothetical protein
MAISAAHFPQIKTLADVTFVHMAAPTRGHSPRARTGSRIDRGRFDALYLTPVIRDGRMRGASLTTRRQGHLPAPSRRADSNDGHPVSGESRFTLTLASGTRPANSAGLRRRNPLSPSRRRPQLRAPTPSRRAGSGSLFRSQELSGSSSLAGQSVEEAQTTLNGTGFPTTPPLLLASLLVAPLAQLAEQLTLNQRVGGSIPSRRTISAGHRPAGWRSSFTEGRHPHFTNPLFTVFG